MLHVRNVTFGYSNEHIILQNFNFSLQKGEVLCVMGESGSGKSTLLKAIYGLLDLQDGQIIWNDTQILGPAFNLVPGFEHFKYVAQDFDLMPYTTVSENIQKFLSRFYPTESKKRTDELLEVIEMTAFVNQKVKTLSGGQQQRVAIARALAKEPKLILLDEPFSQIDNFKKNTLRRKLFAYLKEKNIACIVATHDSSDALSFADKMLVIKNHRILVNDSPKNIYENPTNTYVAALFDDVNELTIDGKTQLFYPHQLQLVEDSVTKASSIRVKATVVQSYYKGSFWLIKATHNQQTLFFKHHSSLPKNSVVFVDLV